MLGDVDNHRLFPAKQEVTEGGTEHHGQTQPRVVRHEDQHQQEAQRHLDDVQERLEQVHHRQHRGWLLVDHFADHVHNPGTVVAAFPATTDAVKGAAATTGSRPGSRQSVPVVVRRNDDVPVPGALLGDRDGPVLEGVVRPPEQVLPVVLEALVERGHREDEQHRPEQTGQAVDFPLLEQDRLVVTAVERHRHHVVDHSFHPAATGRAVPVTVSAVPSRDAATVHRVILQAVFHRAVVVTVVVHSGSAARPAMVHQHVLAVVVMLRVVHIRFLLLMFRRAGQHAFPPDAPVQLGELVPFGKITRNTTTLVGLALVR